MIREATNRDLTPLVEIGKEFADLLGMKEFDTNDMIAFLTEMLNRNDHGLFVAEDENRIVGVVGCDIQPYPHNHRRYLASEMFWWVDPKEREKGHGVDLLRAFEKWADEKGAEEAIATSSMWDGCDYVGAVYERNGYTLTEKSYTKCLRK